jgi:hypothetical protein
MEKVVNNILGCYRFIENKNWQLFQQKNKKYYNKRQITCVLKIIINKQIQQISCILQQLAIPTNPH